MTSATCGPRISALLIVALFASGVSAQQYVYPAKGQSPDQQKKDEGECHVWAVQQSKYDPANPPQGATTNPAGAAAAAGAAPARAQSRRQTAAQAQQQQQGASQQQSAGMAAYQKARAACL